MSECKRGFITWRDFGFFAVLGFFRGLALKNEKVHPSVDIKDFVDPLSLFAGPHNWVLFTFKNFATIAAFFGGFLSLQGK